MTSPASGRMPIGQRNRHRGWLCTVIGLGALAVLVPTWVANASVSPPPPTNVTPTPGDSEVTISWTEPTTTLPIIGFYVYDGTASGGESTTPASPLISGTKYSVPALTNGTTYYFYVVSAIKGSTSQPSTEVSATPGLSQTITFAPPPRAPVGTFTIAATASSGLTVSFASDAAICTVTGTTVTATGTGDSADGGVGCE